MEQRNFYVIDTSSLIELNYRYPMDTFPTLWKKISALIKSGLLISHKEVYKEIEIMDDDLKKWASKQKNFFKEIDTNQLKIATQIINAYPSLIDPAKTSSADPFVIALTITLSNDPQKKIFSNGHLIVTEEKIRGNRIRIPYVCQTYNIKCIDIREMYKEEKWKF
ncbi:MAG: DUF4411 family protein [archaeon]|jgi:hypothetical protein